jgi:crotonobetainyl-CoA:carnitine CoA-transferase CaiB-like acyl-CoA transferase
MLAIGNDEQFKKFCDIAGLSNVSAQVAYATNAARVQAREELIPLVEAATRKQNSAWWLGKLSDAHVPCGPINTLDQVFSDPQVQARGMVLEQVHPSAGSVRTVRNPVVFSESALEYQQAPPVLGEHTEEVLRELLGKDEVEIAWLKQDGIV